MGKIKPGGVLVFDNTERDEYQPAYEALSDWSRRDYVDWMTITSVLVKPE